MKSITNLGFELNSYSIPYVNLAIWNESNHCFDFKTISIRIIIDGSENYKVNDQISLVDWVRSTLQGKLIIPVDLNINIPDYFQVMGVESLDLDYILLTLLLILEKLNKDESVTFKIIQYEEHY